MLGRALHTHNSSSGTKLQKPFRPNLAAANFPRPAESNKRKFERTISTTNTLGAFHESTVFWDENDFEGDDAAIDLSDSPPPMAKPDVQYASLDRALSEVAYPKLPPLPNQTPISSSAPVAWSSSPVEHLEIPKPPVRDPDIRPTKRRTVPWLDKNGDDKTDYAHDQTYPWNKTASAMKKEQTELRKRNRVLAQQPQPQTTKASRKTIPRTHLSEEQKHILDAVVEGGKSIFFTGAAGTGKSVLMRAIINRLRDKYKREPDRIAVTASTGLAACNIEGITLHSFAGIGLGRDPAPELVRRIKRTGALKQRWIRTKVLIIDEISMVDGDLFDKLEQIARMVRGNGRPFGGIQLVLTGDFLQLPPVPGKHSTAKFAFDAATWSTCIEFTTILTQVYRQKDPVFANMLHEMRVGKMTPATIAAFKRLSRPLESDEIDATELFPTRAEVEMSNRLRMSKLLGQEMTFTAIDSGSQDPATRTRTLSNSLAAESLTLKKGAQVMLIKNIDSQLVNGSIGRVQCFMNENSFELYKDHEEMWIQSQLPEDVGDAEQNAINAKARAAINAARNKSDVPTGKIWPLVRFSLPDGTSRELLCCPEEFKTEAPGGEILAKRVQVPLILAWALSIHKAQGQTLEKVKCNLAKIFERSQVYVALSRSVSQAGLQVLNFDPKQVRVDPRVIKFYNDLVSINSVLEKSDTTGFSTSDYEKRGVYDTEEDDELDYQYG